MPESLQTIEMDFAEARRQAQELEQIAGNLNTLVNGTFQPCLRGIAAGWKGENAQVFCKKGAVVGEQIARSASDLRLVAETIRQMAENTYRAEKKICEIAAGRTY